MVYESQHQHPVLVVMCPELYIIPHGKIYTNERCEGLYIADLGKRERIHKIPIHIPLRSIIEIINAGLYSGGSFCSGIRMQNIELGEIRIDKRVISES